MSFERMKGYFYRIRTRLPLISSAMSVIASLLERDILLQQLEMKCCAIEANGVVGKEVKQQKRNLVKATRRRLGTASVGPRRRAIDQITAKHRRSPGPLCDGSTYFTNVMILPHDMALLDICR